MTAPLVDVAQTRAVTVGATPERVRYATAASRLSTAEPRRMVAVAAGPSGIDRGSLDAEEGPDGDQHHRSHLVEDRPEPLLLAPEIGGEDRRVEGQHGDDDEDEQGDELGHGDDDVDRAGNGACGRVPPLNERSSHTDHAKQVKTVSERNGTTSNQ